MDLLSNIVLGVHLASVHVPSYNEQQNFNPGLYARLENGVTIGSYRNTYNKTTVYAGYTTPEYYKISLTATLASGYQQEIHKGYLTPVLAPSIRLPEVGTISPRITYIPGLAGKSNVFHLSLERKF
jgi:hypothetical protein